MTALVIEAPFAPPPPRLGMAGLPGQIARFPGTAETSERQQRLLAAVATSRDTGAFMVLFSYFAPRLKAYMKKLGASDELAEELAQDVMFTVWRKADHYDAAKSPVSSWVFTIARNLRIDALRREHRRAIDVNEPALAPEPQPGPDFELQAFQQRRQVRAMLDTLPPEQAAVVSLAFYGGKSHGEIAAQLAIPLGTVKSRMRLAFQRLRDAIEGTPARAAVAA